jgi:hypothetical protein
MNWYVKIASRFGTSAMWANELSGKILNAIKAGKRKSGRFKVPNAPFVAQDAPVKRDLVVRWVVVQGRPKRAGRIFDVSGVNQVAFKVPPGSDRFSRMVDESPLKDGACKIEVTIVTSVWPFPRQLYEELAFRIKEAIRHEIDHINRWGEVGREKTVEGLDRSVRDSKHMNRVKQWDRGAYAAWYLLRPHEVSAYVSGMVFKAKKQRVPVKTLMVERLTDISEVMWKGAPEQSATKLLVQIWAAWLGELKKRYPKVYEFGGFSDAGVQPPASKSVESTPPEGGENVQPDEIR